jgi:hypothetical protein
MSDYMEEGARLAMLFLEKVKRMTPQQKRQTLIDAKILDREGNLTTLYGGTGEPTDDLERKMAAGLGPGEPPPPRKAGEPHYPQPTRLRDP